jgi:hypothetical protein
MPDAAIPLIGTARAPPRHRFLDRCDRGVQYTVFDLRDGRVLKIPRPFAVRLWHLIQQNRPLTRAALAEVVATARRQETRLDEALAGVQAILPRIDRDLVGNPEFFADGCYTQDKIVPLHRALLRAEPTGQRRLIDLYIESVLASWRNGFFDRGFHFLQNSGIAGGARAMFVDLGDIRNRRQGIVHSVERRDWLVSRSYTRLVRTNIPLARYFVAAAEDAFTPAAVRSLWPAARDDVRAYDPQHSSRHPGPSEAEPSRTQME